MSDDSFNANEKMALWLAYTVKEFTSDEIQTLSIALQTKLDELKGIIDDGK